MAAKATLPSPQTDKTLSSTLLCVEVALQELYEHLSEMISYMASSRGSVANFYFHLSYSQLPPRSSDFTFLEQWMCMNDSIHFKLLYEYPLACDLFIR